MIFNLKYLLIILLLIEVLTQDVINTKRGVIIVTLAGSERLSEYFEWSCRSIGYSDSFYDMLVFHENNNKLKDISCAKNVKFIDLHVNGFSKIIVAQILANKTSNEAIRGDLTEMLSEIIINIPRYLIEIKPIFGSLFKDYLATYSHWSYTDPDIIWGDLTRWIDNNDYNDYDIVTLGKLNDAGRLFIRGQFALHKNNDQVNLLWNKLDYFTPDIFAKRISKAINMLKQKKFKPLEIFNTNFYSAEGYYSVIVLDSDLNVKIIGRGFDDFDTNPVVLINGNLIRVNNEEVLPLLHTFLNQLPAVVSVKNMNGIIPISVTSIKHPFACRMQWLPKTIRYCLVDEVYNKKNKALISNEFNQHSYRLKKVGESYLKNHTWLINDEKLSKRQVSNNAAFFHFRNWDDFVSKSLVTVWLNKANSMLFSSSYNISSNIIDDCMVLYIRDDNAMVFENCNAIIKKNEFKSAHNKINNRIKKE